MLPSACFKTWHLELGSRVNQFCRVDAIDSLQVRLLACKGQVFGLGMVARARLSPPSTTPTKDYSTGELAPGELPGAVILIWSLCREIATPGVQVSGVCQW